MGVLVTVCREGVFLPDEREWDSQIMPINNSFRRSLLYIDEYAVLMGMTLDIEQTCAPMSFAVPR